MKAKRRITRNGLYAVFLELNDTKLFLFPDFDNDSPYARALCARASISGLIASCWGSNDIGEVAWYDHSTYTKLGSAEVALAEDFVIIDCGLFPNDPADTIRTGQKLYIEKMKDSRRDFFQLNTRVTIENGMITEINRRWIP